MNFRQLLGVFLLVLCPFFSLSAQDEADIWYFGNNAGIDFSLGLPQVQTDGAYYNVEACVSMSDENGNLLFYSDGETLWNADHMPMLNGTGLMGDGSATQMIAIQQPCQEDMYYLFTQDAQGGPDGLRYHTIDMNLDGGLGGVVAPETNVLLYAPASEKLTAVQHANAVDTWLIAHEGGGTAGSDLFLVYLITQAGIEGPQTYNIGSLQFNGMGSMKVSHDGGKLVSTVGGTDPGIDLMDFDINTGELSNSQFITHTTLPWGTEFSPDDSKLYVTEANQRELWQYDMAAADIAASKTLIASGDSSLPPVFAGLQLAPNGRIYMARGNSNFLGVIADPNALGTACNFTEESLDLGTYGRWGLPNYNQSIFNPAPAFVSHDFTFTGNCLGEETLFSLTTTEQIDSLIWDFGEPASGTANASTELAPAHTYAATGDYNIRLITYYKCERDTVDQLISIGEEMTVDLGEDQSACEGTTITLDASVTEADASYAWQDGSTMPTLDVSTSGTYSVEVTTICGILTDEIIVNIEDVPTINFATTDTTICSGESWLIDANYANATYTWQDGSTDATFLAAEAGSYEVTIATDCGSNSIVFTLGVDEECETEEEEEEGENNCSFLLPTAFSPNNDGVNDQFTPVLCNTETNYLFRVYSRFGDLIFESTDPAISWDGTNKGTSCNVGIYPWYATFNNADGTPEKHAGQVTLLR